MRLERLLGILLLIAAILFHPPAIAAKLRPDWSSVRGIERGRKIQLVFYAAESLTPIKGRLDSVTANAVTIINTDGQTRTFARERVRKVSVRRPLSKNAHAWAAAGLGLAFVGWSATQYADDNIERDRRTSALLLIVALPAWGITALATAYKSIYNVPAKHKGKVAGAASGGEQEKQANP